MATDLTTTNILLGILAAVSLLVGQWRAGDAVPNKPS